MADEPASSNANYERMAMVIARTPYMKHLGMEFVEAREGWARLKMRYQDENSTAAKALHGGAISSPGKKGGAVEAKLVCRFTRSCDQDHLKTYGSFKEHISRQLRCCSTAKLPEDRVHFVGFLGTVQKAFN